MSIYDELRGMIVDLPVGTILPGWVSKAAVITAIDKLEQERELACDVVDVAVQQERIRLGLVRGHSDDDEFCHCPDCVSYMAEDQ